MVEHKSNYNVELALKAMPIRNRGIVLTWLKQLHREAVTLNQEHHKNVVVIRVNGWPVMSDSLIELFSSQPETVSEAGFQFLKQMYFHEAFAKDVGSDQFELTMIDSELCCQTLTSDFLNGKEVKVELKNTF